VSTEPIRSAPAEKSQRIDADLYLEVMQWLNREAELLDDNRLSEWLDLVADEIVYQMPIRLTRERGQNPNRSFKNQHFLENRHTLDLRIRRLKTEFAWAEDPPSRTRRFVSNVRIWPRSDQELEVRSYLLVYRNRGDQSAADLLSAERQDVLRRDQVGWKLTSRIITLDQSTVGTKNLAILL
jgi:3-phenylpropionate/cinnamic acid dioxygenase small subunit